MPEIYTVWCGKGRVGTYHTRAQAEAVIADIQQILKSTCTSRSGYQRTMSIRMLRLKKKVRSE